MKTLKIVAGLCAILFASLSTALAAEPWPTRPVRFIIPLGPGSGSDICARLFAEKLSVIWGQPVVVENRTGGDSLVAIKAFLTSNDNHALLFGPSGNFTVHPFVYQTLPYDPADLVPIARTSTTLVATAVNAKAPYNNLKEFTEAIRANPGKMNYGAVPGITEFTFWGYLDHEKLQMTQVPYRDFNLATSDLGEGRIQAVMSAYASLQPKIEAGLIKLITVNNQARIPSAPGVPTAREQGYSSIELEGLVGLFGSKSLSESLKQKIAADIRKAADDGSIAERLKATGLVLNLGGPQEFTEAIDEQRKSVAATVKAIDFQPRK